MDFGSHNILQSVVIGFVILLFLLLFRRRVK
jgi:hypothetical protein